MLVFYASLPTQEVAAERKNRGREEIVRQHDFLGFLALSLYAIEGGPHVGSGRAFMVTLSYLD